MPMTGRVPTLTTDGVTLRAHRPSDAAGVLEQCLDPLSRTWTTVPLDYTYLDAQQFLGETMPRGWEQDTEWGFAVEAVDDDGAARYAGTISLRNRGSGRAEVAYGSHPWVRGRGAMEAALRLLLSWGFEERGLETVIWWANRGNWASRKLAWRLGFTFEGGPRHWLPQRGELVDAWVGTLLASDERRPSTPWYAVPRISGRQVVLRRHEERDAQRVLEACADPDTWGWIGTIPHPSTLADAEAYIVSREEEHAGGTAVSWAVADPVTDELLGSLTLFRIRPGHEAEIGYWVHPDARGRGVATEACRLAVRHALLPEEDGGLGLARVRAVAAEGNSASRRVLEKAGLRPQGRERLHIVTGRVTGRVTGEGGAERRELADAVVHDILAAELAAAPAAEASDRD
jgi:RimJ/RimL family protein N-acetyltransferase